jgi:hypothetical protein
MVKKTLNRKEFLKTTMAGMAGIGLVSGKLEEILNANPSIRSIGNTGLIIRVHLYIR